MPAYLLLRYHNILCSRLFLIFTHAERLILHKNQEQNKIKNSQLKSHLRFDNGYGKFDNVAEILGLKNNNGIDVDDYYVAFIDQVKKLLDGNIDRLHYEDNLRDLFSTKAYHMFTIDRVIINCVKALQQVCSDNHHMLDAHKQFRRVISGESRSTPNHASLHDMTDTEALDEKHEAGQFLWHEWPGNANFDENPPTSAQQIDQQIWLKKLTDENYVNFCRNYQQNVIDNCARFETNGFKIIVHLTEDNKLDMNITFLPLNLCLEHSTIQDEEEESEEGENVEGRTQEVSQTRNSQGRNGKKLKKKELTPQPEVEEENDEDEDNEEDDNEEDEDEEEDENGDEMQDENQKQVLEGSGEF